MVYILSDDAVLTKYNVNLVISRRVAKIHIRFLTTTVLNLDLQVLPKPIVSSLTLVSSEIDSISVSTKKFGYIA